MLLGQLEELARSRGAVSAFGTGGYGITSQQAEPHRRGGPAVIVLIDARIPG